MKSFDVITRAPFRSVTISCIAENVANQTPEIAFDNVTSLVLRESDSQLKIICLYIATKAQQTLN